MGHLGFEFLTLFLVSVAKNLNKVINPHVCVECNSFHSNPMYCNVKTVKPHIELFCWKINFNVNVVDCLKIRLHSFNSVESYHCAFSFL